MKISPLPERGSRMESFEEYTAKTLGVKIPEEYASFMEKHGRKLAADPVREKSWVSGLGDRDFVVGTTQAFRALTPQFPPENVVIGYLGMKRIVINRTYEEIENYLVLNSQDGKILSVDSRGVLEAVSDSFEEWVGPQLQRAELKEKYESTLTVVLFDDELKAEDARVNLAKLKRQGYVDLEDVVVVVKKADGTITYRQTRKRAGKGGAAGSVTGFVVGALLMQPLLGAVVGALTGAISASLVDTGIQDNFITDLAANFQAGSSALFALVRKSEPEKVLETFQGFGGKILVTSMSEERATALQAHLDSDRESIHRDLE
jgi:uncharacterized membrane protein